MPNARSLLSKLKLTSTFAGAVGFATIMGTHFVLRDKTERYRIRYNDWPDLKLSRFEQDLLSRPEYDPADVRFDTPPEQSVYAYNPLADIIENGHIYDYTSKSFKLPPEARSLLIDSGKAAAVTLIMSFAGGDGLVVRPEAAKSLYPSDFEYTKALLRAGEFPPDSVVSLGGSRVRMSDVLVSVHDDGRYALSLRASTTAQHIFVGHARWELHVEPDGTARINISGAGRAPLFAIDGANNCIASPLWGTTAARFETLMTAYAKDPQVIERSETLEELRDNVHDKSPLDRDVRLRERLLRCLDRATAVGVHLNVISYQSDPPRSLKDSTTQDIKGFLDASPPPGENEFINEGEQQDILQSVASTTASDTPVLSAEAMKPFVHFQEDSPLRPGESEADRRAREEREAEARERQEREWRERQRKELEREERERQRREQEAREHRQHHP